MSNTYRLLKWNNTNLQIECSRYIMVTRFCVEDEENMLDKFWEFVKDNGLKPISALLLLPILVVAYAWVVSNINDWEVATVDNQLLLIAAIPFALAWGVYLVLCLIHYRLPKAPVGTLAVLFCIDAESTKLFETARFKLVNNFKAAIASDAEVQFKELCVPKSRLSKYDLQNKSDVIRLLEKTNSVLLVKVRYSTDDVDDPERFELQINYEMRPTKFDDMANSILSHDMSVLGAPVGRQKFVKAETIDVFNFTTQTLVCACQYIMGFVALLDSNSRMALDLLLRARKTATTEFTDAHVMGNMVNLIDNRLFAALCHVSAEYMTAFQNDKNLQHLHNMCSALTMANAIRPDTYFYNLNMAYAYIILRQDANAAKQCIAKCRQSKEDTNWMYSEAFLSAYLGYAPGSILSKYDKALANPYKSLAEIVEYIELVIDREPEKIALHLAAALVYEEMGDKQLMKRHFSIYLENAKNLDQRARTKVNEKMRVVCERQCDGNCSTCTELVA